MVSRLVKDFGAKCSRHCQPASQLNSFNSFNVSVSCCVLVSLGTEKWPYAAESGWVGGGPEGSVKTCEGTVSNSNHAEFVIAVHLRNGLKFHYYYSRSGSDTRVVGCQVERAACATALGARKWCKGIYRDKESIVSMINGRVEGDCRPRIWEFLLATQRAFLPRLLPAPTLCIGVNSLSVLVHNATAQAILDQYGDAATRAGRFLRRLIVRSSTRVEAIRQRAAESRPARSVCM